MNLNPRFRPLMDVFWLAALTAFILAGMMLATFHGDEAMLIYMSHDYVTVFIDHQPDTLKVQPPYELDGDGWLRILNGSVSRYSIGLSWHLAGLNSGMLPPRPGWDWGLDYDTNVATGHRPSDALLAAGRLPSALLLVLGAAALFAIGRELGARPLAYAASALYTLNPILLLNGRRAMMEGSLMAFGLLAIWVAIRISRGRGGWWAWAALAALSALTLSSKHSGILFVGSALGWIGLCALVRCWSAGRAGWLPFARTVGALLLVGVLAVGLFIALSPALWNDTLARLGDLVTQRQFLLDIQVAAFGGATSIGQRLTDLLTQPFIAPLMHYEVSFWANAQAIQAEVARYMASPLSGLQGGVIVGGLLTVSVAVGLVALLRQRRAAADRWQIGVLAWVLLMTGSALVNPLGWQRYSIPQIPLFALLAAAGLVTVVRWLQRRSSA